MRKILFIFLSIVSLFLPQTTFAEEKSSGSSATFAAILAQQQDDHRVDILRQFLQQYNSPLADNARSFITQADLYNLDWKLLPAIAGVESTFARNEPYQCYNSWGFDIYGDHIHCFVSYDEAIKTIAKTLKEKYIDGWGTQDVYQIGRYYAASPTWAQHVDYFMQKIQQFQIENEEQALSISL